MAKQLTINGFTCSERVIGLAVEVKVGVPPQRQENGDLVPGSWWTETRRTGVVESLEGLCAIVRFNDGTWTYSDRTLRIVQPA